MYSTRLYDHLATSSSPVSIEPDYAALRAVQRAQKRAIRLEERTKRRDVLVLLSFFIVAAFVALTVLNPTKSAVAESRDMQCALATYHVNSGDTLWSIAAQHPHADLSTHETVHWIMDVNDLSTSVLTPGQVILVSQ